VTSEAARAERAHPPGGFQGPRAPCTFGRLFPHQPPPHRPPRANSPRARARRSQRSSRPPPRRRATSTLFVVIHPQATATPSHSHRSGWMAAFCSVNGIRGGICLLARPGVQPQLCSAVQNHTRSHHCLQTCTQLAVVLSLQVFQQFVHSSANLYYGTKRNALIQ